MKEKRDYKNGIIITILSILVIIACFGFGLTYSYFSSSANAGGTVTIGTLQLGELKNGDSESFTFPASPVVPNQSIVQNTIKAEVKTNISYYTRVLVGAMVEVIEGHSHEETCKDYVADDVEILEIVVGGESEGTWTQLPTNNINGESVYYKLSPTKVEPSSTDLQTKTEEFPISIKVAKFVGSKGCDYYMGATITINLTVEVLQADYLEDSTIGDDFSDVAEMDTKWEKVSPTKINYTGSFQDASWKIIDAIAKTGNADKWFDVGDEKTFLLTTDEEITVVILGFNHDDLVDGGKAGISIGMKDLLSKTYAMNTSKTNEGGWDKSFMRTDRMQTLFEQLPDDLKLYVKEVNKKATAGNQSRQIITSQDKLWLLSISEIWSEEQMTSTGWPYIKTYADILKNEGIQYKYFEDKAVDPYSANSGLVKKKDNGRGSAAIWWLRSPSLVDTIRFFNVYSTGYCSFDAASYSYGVSFNFCI